MAAFLANVGVNASHSARSPLAADGTFTLLPIPEAVSWAPPMLRPADPGLESLRAVMPAGWAERPVHLDPDFLGGVPTYGDNCRTAGRAFSLRRGRAGDLIVFVARLHGPAGPGFHLVGRLRIADVLSDVREDPGHGWWDGNAHVRRARATGAWNSFWVFRGGRGSGLLPAAVRFGRAEAADVLGPIRWLESRTELQTIASCTRAVRRVEGEAAALLERMAA